MPAPRKHFSRWFTTVSMQAINLDWITDIQLHKSNGTVTGATLWYAAHDSDGTSSVLLTADDAISLFDLLE
jgi:hypothetical protein